jgi:probable rRNA maturation factor
MTANPPPQLALSVQWGDELDDMRPRPVQRPQLRRWVQSSLSCDANITLRFVGPVEGQQLNQQFRGKDYATNVLTFPLNAQTLALPPGVTMDCTADIIICWPVVETQARQQGKALLHHLAHLVIHGCLHAQGHDHEDEEQALQMEALEARLLKRFRITDPYQPT